ncbi:hypothetical protein [Methanolobus profundi]|uniref:Uncharacterized protein n=1 Tax=Methanolobus profundi TaxID=487685 RepID=A0A1I4UMT1_9EURY|nr:hypothetical protein [Methanolobus profundi]SFM90292.1 hypothetical protein SAMN04488696_2797 [Methanolobus profundi]
MQFGKKKSKGKNEKIKALRVRPGLDGIDLVSLDVDDETARDPNYNKEYVLSEATIPFSINGKKPEHVYLLDGGKGVSLKMERSDKEESVGEGEDARKVSLLTLRTSPAKVSAILDTTLMQRAYTLKPDRRTIFIAFFLGIGVGFFTGILF